jgi:gamma-glutamyl hydrolase
MLRFIKYFLFAVLWVGISTELTPVQEIPLSNFPAFHTGPVVGIMTQPYKIGDVVDGHFSPFDPATMDPKEHTFEYIPASYKRYLEMAGAKVVPIIHDTSEENLIELLGKINGVLFTGGSLDLVDPQTEEYHPYTKTADRIFEYAKERLEEGDYFPLVGICQGFQLLNILQSEDKFVLKRSPAMIRNDTLKPLREFETSRNFGKMAENAEWYFNNNIVVVNLHNWGIYLSDYVYSRPELYNFYRMITYEEDDDRRLVVTSIEAFNYPIYAYQFHPERNLFEFSIEGNVCPKSPEARQFSEDLMFFFVEETRKNNHSFESLEEENKHLLDSQRRVWGSGMMNGSPYYVEIYLTQRDE